MKKNWKNPHIRQRTIPPPQRTPRTGKTKPAIADATPAKGLPAIARTKEAISAMQKAVMRLLGCELPMRLPTKKPIIAEISLSMYQTMLASDALIVVVVFAFDGHLLV